MNTLTRTPAHSQPAESTADEGPKPSPGLSSSAETSLSDLWAAYLEDPTEERRNRLVEAYQPLVARIVRRFCQRLPRSVDRENLETAASVGLIAAVEAFDQNRGVRFESYCELRTKGALLDELRMQDWLPRPKRQQVEQHRRLRERLRSELGVEPGEDVLASRLGLSLEVYHQHFHGQTCVAPGAYSQVDDPPSIGSFMECFPDQHCEEPGDRLTRGELLQLIADRLSAQEYQVLFLKYWEGLSMREIGELTQLSESRVSKVHARLIERLRERLCYHQG